MSPGGQNHALLRTTNLDDRSKFSKLKEKEGQWSWQLLSEQKCCQDRLRKIEERPSNSLVWKEKMKYYSFNAVWWKYICISKCCAVLSHVWLFATPWTITRQAPPSMGILWARILEWFAMPSSRGSSKPRNQTQVSRTAGGFFTVWATRKAQEYWSR